MGKCTIEMPRRKPLELCTKRNRCKQEQRAHLERSSSKNRILQPVTQVKEEPEDVIEFEEDWIHKVKEEPKDWIDFENVQIHQVKEELDDAIEFEEEWRNKLQEEDGAFNCAEKQKVDGNDDDDHEEKVKPPLRAFVSRYENADDNVESGENCIVDEGYQDLHISDIKIKEEEEEVEDCSSDAGIFGFEDYEEGSRESTHHFNVNNSQSAADSQMHDSPEHRKWQHQTKRFSYHTCLTDNVPIIKTYKCSECSHASPDNFTQCPVCKHSNFEKCNFKSKMIIHTYICPRCDFTTLNIWALRGHITTHGPEKPFKCSHCEFRTTQQSYLRRHERRHEKPPENVNDKEHSEAPRFKCEQCPFTTLYKFNLSCHSVTHRKNMSYKCSDCDFEATLKKNLKSHEMIHHKPKPYKCSQCDYVAIQKRHLISHMKFHKAETKATHLKERTYKCPDCEFATTFKISLRKHRHIHKVRKIDQCSPFDSSVQPSNTSTRRKQLLKPRSDY